MLTVSARNGKCAARAHLENMALLLSSASLKPEPARPSAELAPASVLLTPSVPRRTLSAYGSANVFHIPFSRHVAKILTSATSLRHVSGSSIQLCWRATARAGDRSFLKKKSIVWVGGLRSFLSSFFEWRCFDKARRNPTY